MGDTSESYNLGAIATSSDAASDAASKAAVAQSTGSDASSAASIALVKAVAASQAAAANACTHYDIDVGDSLTDSDGQDQDRTTGSSYTIQYGDVVLLSPFYLTSVEWDFKGAATYTLYIDDVQFGSAYVAAGDTADAAFNGTRMLDAGVHRFKISRSASGQFYDKNTATFSDSIWTSTGLYYTTTYYNSYTVPMKLTGYVGAWAVCGSS
jgi:hypothetical protein